MMKENEIALGGEVHRITPGMIMNRHDGGKASMTVRMTIPGHNPDQRQLCFDSIDDLRAEIDRIVEADHAGTLECRGTWSAGQTFGHLAAWIEYNYAGYPFKVPAPIRLAARMMKRRVLTRPMRPGIRLPGVSGGTFATESMSTEEGARRLRDALDRLDRREPLQHPSPALGPMTLDECVALNLRHAELHLGYLHPTRAGADSQ